jgi:hypothetical protein
MSIWTFLKRYVYVFKNCLHTSVLNSVLNSGSMLQLKYFCGDSNTCSFAYAKWGDPYAASTRWFGFVNIFAKLLATFNNGYPKWLKWLWCAYLCNVCVHYSSELKKNFLELLLVILGIPIYLILCSNAFRFKGFTIKTVLGKKIISSFWNSLMR